MKTICISFNSFMYEHRICNLKLLYNFHNLIVFKLIPSVFEYSVNRCSQQNMSLYTLHAVT